MSDTLNPQPDSSPFVIYQIRVMGQLGDQWADWFDCLSITQEESETLLICPVIDQSALYGMLRKIRDLGLPLISVIRVNPQQE